MKYKFERKFIIINWLEFECEVIYLEVFDILLVLII